jgi:two-component system LytT family response regulator
MRVLIVDDEPLALTALANILSVRQEVEYFDSACNAVDALVKIKEHRYDVLLLDIHMPEVSGLELIDEIRKRPQPWPAVVFVTAHDEHAITAFEIHAVDYVLKPFSSERVDQALEVAFHRTAAERAARLLDDLPPQLHSTIDAPRRIAIKSSGRILFVDPSEVQTVRAEGNYVLLERRNGSYLIREPISSIAETLRPYGFIRIHRSVLINSSFVENIRASFTGEYELRLISGKEFIVTRTYKKNLKALAQCWIGTDAFD